MGMAAADAQFHILAVDDNLVDRKVIERVLKSSSFQVTTVDSGSKALEFLGWNEEDEKSNCNEASVIPPKIHREVEVNLVITDYCMPGMTGYDLLKKMKGSSSLSTIPVVIMSSENVPSRITRCLEEGAEKFLLKPVSASDVNKLRPHMMKTKCNNNNNNSNFEENLENDEEIQENKKSRDEDIHLQQNNKRKSMEEADRTTRSRPRYNNGLTVMSN